MTFSATISNQKLEVDTQYTDSQISVDNKWDNSAVKNTGKSRQAPQKRKWALQIIKFGMLSFAVLGLCPKPSTADTTLVATEIRDIETCLDALEEFNWVCQEFNHLGWARTFGHNYWERGHLLFYRHDIDGDGTEDAIIKTEHVGLCSRGGPDCSHFFLFGDQPMADHPHVHGRYGEGAPVLTERDGVAGLYFSIRNPNVFHSIESIREKTLRAKQRSIEKRGVGE